MALPPKDQEEPPDEAWMTTFADAITLLMAFFVMLLTFAEFDIPAFEKAAEAIKANIGAGEQQVTTTQQLKFDVEDVMVEMSADQVVEVSTDDKGITIELDGGAFFKPGSAELHPAAIPVINKMAQTVKAPRYNFYNMEVEGHTDDEPISTKAFPSNWELSAARAARVVRAMIEQDMEPLKFKSVGYAETRPKVPNRDREGNPIPENQRDNRRIVIRVFHMNLDERQAYADILAEKELIRRQKERERKAQEKAKREAQQQGQTGQPAPAQ